jgi:hypothetical protein
LLLLAPEYPVETQAKMVPAMAAVHNFIRIHDPDDITDDIHVGGGPGPTQSTRLQQEQLGGEISTTERN